jgi:hypothetical protein
MGREVKRVSLNFTWPLRKVWRGYLYDGPTAKRCTACDGTGYNSATKQLSDDWYDSDNFGVTWTYNYNVGRDGRPATRPPWQVRGSTKRWMHDITDHEVRALAFAGRLHDFGQQWDPEKNVYVLTRGLPTADEVNEWSHHFFGHDAINRHICVEARARRLGVYGLCRVCKGKTRLPRKAKKYEKKWQRTEPPAGPGWQVWETVSEGSPVTPVFASADALVAHLVEHDDYSVEAAVRFVRDDGWVPSLIMTGGLLYRDIESAGILSQPET